MTLTIELTPEEEARLRELAAEQGTGELEAAHQMLLHSLFPRPIPQAEARLEGGTTLTAGAALLQDLQHEGLLGLYGEDTPDSPHAATALRERVWKREAA